MPARPPHYFESWHPQRAALSHPPSGECNADDPASVHLYDAYERAQRDADWFVYGSGMMPPTTCTARDGSPVVLDDRRILAQVGTIVSDRGRDAPTKEQIARRIAACVNACEGLVDPERAIVEARELLADLVRGQPIDDGRAIRVWALLSHADGYSRNRPKDTLED